MIVVTGATGRTGRQVTEALLAKGENVRAVGRDAKKLTSLVQKGADPLVADVADAQAMSIGFAGASAVYLVLPEDIAHSDLRGYQERVSDSYAAAISRAQVPFVVNLSSLGAQHSKGTGPIVGLHSQEVKLNQVGGLIRKTMTTFTTPPVSSPIASLKINHAAIRVPDFDAAVAWYADKLDFRLKQSVPVAGLTFGFLHPDGDDSFHFELMAGSGAAERPPYKNLHDSYNMSGWHHLGFSVDSVDDVIEELKRRCVTIESEPHDVPALGLRVAFFADPWGNLFEVIQSIRKEL